LQILKSPASAPGFLFARILRASACAMSSQETPGQPDATVQATMRRSLDAAQSLSNQAPVRFTT
jgi:hypothetical protein